MTAYTTLYPEGRNRGIRAEAGAVVELVRGTDKATITVARIDAGAVGTFFDAGSGRYRTYVPTYLRTADMWKVVSVKNPVRLPTEPGSIVAYGRVGLGELTSDLQWMLIGGSHMSPEQFTDLLESINAAPQVLRTGYGI